MVDRLEADPAFCNACHLPDGTPLHAAKLRIARATPHLDLTAVHLQQTRLPHAGCTACHRGQGWRARAAVLGESAWNTLRYAVDDYGEPERLVFPIADRSCTQCHPEPTVPGDPERFHGIKAHLDQVGIRCMDCHRSHAAPGTGAAGHAAAVTAASRAVCGRCHKGEPPAPHVLALLARYRGDLLRRMEGVR